MTVEEKIAAIIVGLILFVQPFVDPNPWTLAEGILSLMGLLVIVAIAIDAESSRFWRDIQRLW